MRNSVLFFGSVLAALSAGCGGGYEIAAGDLSGKIDGQAFTYKSAWTDAFLSDSDGYFTNFYPEKLDACGFGGGTSDLVVITSIPKEVGEYELGLSPNVTLAKGSDNHIATTGLMVVDKSDGKTLEGGIYAIFNDDENFEISGHFVATICADTPPP